LPYAACESGFRCSFPQSDKKLNSGNHCRPGEYYQANASPRVRHEAPLPMKYLPLLAAFAVLSPPSASKADDQTDPGAQIYMKSHCFACHGQMGGGGFGPALAGDRILAIQKFVVAQILIGRGKMPEFGSRLSNQEIAAVAQYIRNHWGNRFGPVTADDVESVRKLMKKASEEAVKANTPEKP